MKPGPIDRAPWPEHLSAHCLHEGRVHGYEVRGDLDRHFRWLDVAVLGLSGELPSDQARVAIDITMMHLLPTHAGDGVVHAAVLARIAGGPESPSPHAALVAAAESARADLAEFERLETWRRGESAAPPALYVEGDQARSDALRRALDSAGLGAERWRVHDELNLLGNALCLLMEAGVTTRAGLEALLILARTPLALAEASRHQASSFASYPMNVPRMVLEPEPDEG